MRSRGKRIIFFFLWEAFCGLKHAENVIAAGAPPQTLLGELTTLPRPPSCLLMLIYALVPVWVNLVLRIYPLYGPWKVLEFDFDKWARTMFCCFPEVVKLLWVLLQQSWPIAPMVCISVFCHLSAAGLVMLSACVQATDSVAWLVVCCRRRTWSTWKWWSVTTCTWMLCQASCRRVHCGTLDPRMTWRHRRHHQHHRCRPSVHHRLSQRWVPVVELLELCLWQTVSLTMLTAGHRKMTTSFRSDSLSQQ